MTQLESSFSPSPWTNKKKCIITSSCSSFWCLWSADLNVMNEAVQPLPYNLFWSQVDVWRLCSLCYLESNKFSKYWITKFIPNDVWMVLMMTVVLRHYHIIIQDATTESKKAKDYITSQSVIHLASQPTYPECLINLQEDLLFLLVRSRRIFQWCSFTLFDWKDWG